MRFTAVLTIAADGKKLLPMIIFKGEYKKSTVEGTERYHLPVHRIAYRL